jgi:hypothetical protein
MKTHEFHSFSCARVVCELSESKALKSQLTFEYLCRFTSCSAHVCLHLALAEHMCTCRLQAHGADSHPTCLNTQAHTCECLHARRMRSSRHVHMRASMHTCIDVIMHVDMRRSMRVYARNQACYIHARGIMYIKMYTYIHTYIVTCIHSRQ